MSCQRTFLGGRYIVSSIIGSRRDELTILGLPLRAAPIAPIEEDIVLLIAAVVISLIGVSTPSYSLEYR